MRYLLSNVAMLLTSSPTSLHTNTHFILWTALANYSTGGIPEITKVIHWLEHGKGREFMLPISIADLYTYHQLEV